MKYYCHRLIVLFNHLKKCLGLSKGKIELIIIEIEPRDPHKDQVQNNKDCLLF